MPIGCLSPSLTDAALRSRNGHRMSRFEAAELDLLPNGHVFDGELRKLR
jgi:hypothetical protein